MNKSTKSSTDVADISCRNNIEFINCDDFSRQKFGNIFCKPSGELYFHCEHCDQDFVEANIHEHIDLVFENKTELKLHIDKETHNEHNISANKASISDAPDDMQSQSVSSHVPPLRSIKCSYCDAIFPCHGIKEEHKITHGIKIKENFCTQCKSAWRTKSQLKDHIHSVHQPGQPVFTCQHCSISFVSNNDLIAHQTTRPLTKSAVASATRRQRLKISKTYKCTACPEIFNSMRAQREHFIVHGDKPFKCSECSYAFRRLSSLKEHMRQHNDDKPFVCDICGKQFPTKSYVRIHLRLHVGDRPYSCTKCDMTFAISWQLSRHLQSKHSSEAPKHVCDICGKSFKWPVRLFEHKRVHNGEKPFSCTFCDKSFTRQNTCRLHMRLHAGEKPFQCRYCDVSFKHSFGRLVHEREHHGAAKSAMASKI